MIIQFWLFIFWFFIFLIVLKNFYRKSLTTKYNYKFNYLPNDIIKLISKFCVEKEDNILPRYKIRRLKEFLSDKCLMYHIHDAVDRRFVT